MLSRLSVPQLIEHLQPLVAKHGMRILLEGDSQTGYLLALTGSTPTQIQPFDPGEPMEGISLRQLLDRIDELLPHGEHMKVILNGRPMERTDIVVAEGYIGPQYIKSQEVGVNPEHFTNMVYIGEG